MYIGEDKLRFWLESQGFKFEIDRFKYRENECNWNAYRRSKLEARECECNAGKGIQIVINPSAFTLNGVRHRSVEIELCGEANGTWWKACAYAINPDDLSDKLDKVERSLIQAWNALCN